MGVVYDFETTCYIYYEILLASNLSLELLSWNCLQIRAASNELLPDEHVRDSALTIQLLQVVLDSG